MAGGPLHPFSREPDTGGFAIPLIVQNGTHLERVMAVAGGLTAGQAIWKLEFALPETLPAGSPKLVIISKSDRDHEAGADRKIAIQPKWDLLARSGGDYGGITLNAETKTDVVWVNGTGPVDINKETIIALDDETFTAGDMIVMDLVFGSPATGTVMPIVTSHIAFIIWV